MHVKEKAIIWIYIQKHLKSKSIIYQFRTSYIKLHVGEVK